MTSLVYYRKSVILKLERIFNKYEKTKMETWGINNVFTW